MNDNIIINIISRTYFNIVGFFIFIFIIVSTLFIFLQNGLYLKEFSVSNIHIKQLYIKWNEKLDISVSEVTIEQNNDSPTIPLDTSKINQYFTSFSIVKEWFRSLYMKKIVYGDIEGSFSYKIGESGILKVKSPTFTLNTTLDLSPQSMRLTVNSFKVAKHHINANGVLYFDTLSHILYSNLHTKLSDVADFTIYTMFGKEKVYYKLKSNKNIEDLEYLINLADIPKEVRYWAYDAIGMSYATLGDIRGYVKYNDIKNAYKHVHITATLHDATYTYNKDLDAIHTKTIELEFKNGLFYIHPKEAYSYGMYLDKSWVLIDFTAKKEVQLTLSLLFDAELNTSILKILNTYHIKVPFLQKRGKVATDLKINVGLQSISVGANGTFYTKNSNFDYLGLNIDVADATIFLDNYNVFIKNMHASYQDIANATVNATYDAKSATGKIDFQLDNPSFFGISRKNSTKPLHLTYNIVPKQDSITVEASQWIYKGHTISFDRVELPFDLTSLNVTIPATLITLENIGDAFISGTVNIKTFLSDIDIDVLNFKYNGFETLQSNTPLHLHYKKRLKITSDNSIHLNFNGSKYKLDKFFLVIDKEHLYLKHTLLNIGKYLQTKIYAKLNTQTNTAHISLNNFILKDPDSDTLLYKKDRILLSLEIIDKKIKIFSKELAAIFVSQETGWRLKFNAIKHISKNSQFLKKLCITDGEFTLFKNKDDKYTRFKAKLTYPYKILLKDKEPTDQYSVKGKLYKKKVYVTINNQLHFTIKDNIQLTLKNTPINISAIVDAMADFTKKESTSSKILNMSVEAQNSYLYVSKKRKILYDTLNLQYLNKILTAKLHYKQGESILKLEGDTFYLYGKNFNDTFMSKLISISRFSKGTLEFSINGTVDEYIGSILVKDTTMRDHVILNNVFAFIDTVPSLISFRVPGYNTKGLYAKQAIIHFKSKKKFFTISDIYLDSKEVKILGKGTMDLNKKIIDIKLNLKSDLGSILSKVPLLGYVILGEDSISTTLKINGDLKNPKVKSLIVEDIVIAPINILKRTLSLPFKLIHNVLDTSKRKVQ